MGSIIAQRFNAWLGIEIPFKSTEGRNNSASVLEPIVYRRASVVPCGTRFLNATVNPALKRWAIFKNRKQSLMNSITSPSSEPALALFEERAQRRQIILPGLECDSVNIVPP